MSTHDVLATAGSAPHAPPPGWRPDVQGLRAVAVLAVVLFHAGGVLPGGYVGVDVFFVISGFVITRSLLREDQRHGRIDLRAFLRRRLRRLTPTLTFVVAVTVAVASLLAPLSAVTRTARTAIGALLLHANVVQQRAGGYFAPAAELDPLLHTWSLSLEEQFYLVYPLLLIGLLVLARRRARALPFGLTVVAALSLALCVWLQTTSTPSLLGTDPGRLAFFLMPARVWQFLAGALVAVALVEDERRLSFPGAAWLGTATLAASFTLLGAVEAVYPGWWALAPTIGTVLLLVAPASPPARLLRHRALVHVGDRSYSWYLWHWPVLVFAGAAGARSTGVLVIVGLATYVLAVWSHRHIEVAYGPAPGEPPSADRAWRAPLAASLAAVLLIGTSTQLAVPGTDLPQIRAARESRLPQAADGCAPVVVTRSVQGCRFPGRPDAPRVVLLGDSNAMQVSDAVVAAGAVAGWDVTTSTHPGCPLVAVEALDRGRRSPDCEYIGRVLFDWVEATRPDLLFLAVAGDLYADSAAWELRAGARTGADAYGAGLISTLARVRAAGTEVVLVHAVPKFSIDEPLPTALDGCSVLRLRLDAQSCALTMSRDEALARRATATDVEQAAAVATGARTLDLFDQLCPTSPCSELRDGIWLYLDDRHLSAAASQQLTSAFTAAGRAALGVATTAGGGTGPAPGT